MVTKKSLFQSCVLLLSCRLYYFNLHDDYPSFLYTTWSIYIAAQSFLIRWNGKQCSKSNILTIGHWFVLEILFQVLLIHCQMPLSIWQLQSICISDWDRSNNTDTNNTGTNNNELIIHWCYWWENWQVCSSGKITF